MSIREPVVAGRPLTQGAVLGADHGVSATIRAFDRAEKQLGAELERISRILAVDPDSTKQYRDAQIRGLRTRLATTRAELQGHATLFAEESMARIYADGMTRADRMIGAAGVGGIGQASFTQIHREAVEVMALDAYNDLAAATDYMDAQAKRVIREATKARTLVGAAAGTGVGQDARALVSDFARDGVTGFTDRAGRRWKISTYAEMVVRTKSAHAYNTGTILRTEETGTRAMRIVDGERSGHAECLAYNRRICSTGWALDHPIEHPNCVRGFAPEPLHQGPVELGADDPAARESLAEELARRHEDGTLPSDLEIDFDNIFDAPGDRDALDAVLGNPALWREGATRRRDGRMMPGEPALAANRALVSRGHRVNAEIDERIVARGGRPVTSRELEAAKAKISETAARYGKSRDAWVDAKVAQGFDWGDAFEASVNQLLGTKGYVVPKGLELDASVITARNRMRAAQRAREEIGHARNAYLREWQTETRALLTERRGAGYVPTSPTMRIDAGVAATFEDAMSRYPRAWADRLDSSMGHLYVQDAAGTRGYNRSRRGSDGQYNSLLNTDDLSTTIHEIGHTFEAIIPGLSDAQWTLLRSRTTGTRGGLESPKVIPTYHRSEKYYPSANTPSPYTAKIYGDGPDSNFEIFTTLAEAALAEPAAYSRYIGDDGELRDWILGVLFHMG